jgi:hypothetical protein
MCISRSFEDCAVTDLVHINTLDFIYGCFGAVMTSLMSTPGRVYRLLTYEQYCALTAAALTNTPGSTVGTPAQSGVKRKFPATDVVSSPVLKPRKKSGRYSV